jgi:hypothetical protein
MRLNRVAFAPTARPSSPPASTAPSSSGAANRPRVEELAGPVLASVDLAADRPTDPVHPTDVRRRASAPARLNRPKSIIAPLDSSGTTLAVTAVDTSPAALE